MLKSKLFICLVMISSLLLGSAIGSTPGMALSLDRCQSKPCELLSEATLRLESAVELLETGGQFIVLTKVMVRAKLRIAKLKVKHAELLLRRCSRTFPDEIPESYRTELREAKKLINRAILSSLRIRGSAEAIIEKIYLAIDQVEEISTSLGCLE